MYLATTTSPLLTKNSLYLFYKKGKGYYLPIVTFFYSPYLFFFFGGGQGGVHSFSNEYYCSCPYPQAHYYVLAFCTAAFSANSFCAEAFFCCSSSS